MKPRIKSGWYRAHGIGVELWGWCEGGGVRKFGLTPEGAYSCWHAERSPPIVRAEPAWWENLFGVRTC